MKMESGLKMRDNKILYLDGNQSDEYYNKLRNSYSEVIATSIFSKNTISHKLLRRLLLKFNLPFHKSLFGLWRNELHKFDSVIIAANMYSPIIKKFIRKQSQIKVIHWYWNPIHMSIDPDLLKDNDSEIWSFDPDDCRIYSLNYSPTYYFEKLQLPENEEAYDVFFVGADKGRINKLLNIESLLLNQGLKVNFHITKSSNSEETVYIFKPRISYSQVLQRISESKAILDVVQENQSGLSQRPMEALFFKKKLISDDTNLVNCDFYKKNNIFILGLDDINNLKEFVCTPYEEVDNEIIQKYTFSAWISRLNNYDKTEVRL